MRKLFFILGLFTFFLVPLSAEQPKLEQLQIEEIAQRVQLENPQLLKALCSLKNAEEALTGESRLLESRLTLEGAYGPTQNQTGPSAELR